MPPQQEPRAIDRDVRELEKYSAEWADHEKRAREKDKEIRAERESILNDHMRKARSFRHQYGITGAAVIERSGNLDSVLLLRIEDGVESNPANLVTDYVNAVYSLLKERAKK
jgi:hypothetical protein